MTNRRKVLITCQQMQNCMAEFAQRFSEHGLEIVSPDITHQQLSEDELIAVIGDVDGMIAGDDHITARVLEHAPRLRIISKWGVGVDGIDREAADRLGIAVTNTPNAFGEDVADVVAGYLVMLARQLHRIHHDVVAGRWHKVEGRRLAASSLGIAGFGSVGQAVGRRGVAFGMTTVAHDPDPGAPARMAAIGVEPVDRDDLFRRADYLVLCAPLTAATRHFVDDRSLGLMRHGSYVVNVARGPLVDEQALVDALRSGRICGAALDVFEDEPLSTDNPLRQFEQCVFGSHNASNTREGILQASARAVDNLLSRL